MNGEDYRMVKNYLLHPRAGESRNLELIAEYLVDLVEKLNDALTEISQGDACYTYEDTKGDDYDTGYDNGWRAAARIAEEARLT